MSPGFIFWWLGLGALLLLLGAGRGGGGGVGLGWGLGLGLGFVNQVGSWNQLRSGPMRSTSGASFSLSKP